MKRSNKAKDNESRFPEGFLWGATRHGHCVEGGNFSADWWHWEQRPGRIRDQSTSRQTADHWARWREDIELARKLGLNAMLVGVEWSRIEPEPGTIAEEPLRQYRSLFEKLNEAGIAPLCVLHYATLPQWCAEAGGWANAETAQRFGGYVSRCAETFQGHCAQWMPFQDPMHVLSNGYLRHVWPPGKGGRRGFRDAVKTQLNAYREAVRILREKQPDAQIGASVAVRPWRPFNPESSFDARAARREERAGLEEYLNALFTSPEYAPDFIGLRALSVGYARHMPLSPGRGRIRRLMQDGAPLGYCSEETNLDALPALARKLAAYGRPLRFLGVGLPTSKDANRSAFMQTLFRVVSDLVAEGAPIEGLYWRSLLDGFEWEHGFTERWGLVHVDFSSLARTPNPSAFFFKAVAEANALSPGIEAAHRPRIASGASDK